MSRKNEDLPAFPAIDEDHYFEGMTKREYIAAKVYPFYLQRAYAYYDNLPDDKKHEFNTTSLEDEASENAYYAATELLEKL